MLTSMAKWTVESVPVKQICASVIDGHTTGTGQTTIRLCARIDERVCALILQAVDDGRKLRQLLQFIAKGASKHVNDAHSTSCWILTCQQGDGIFMLRRGLLLQRTFKVVCLFGKTLTSNCKLSKGNEYFGKQRLAKKGAAYQEIRVAHVPFVGQEPLPLWLLWCGPVRWQQFYPAYWSVGVRRIPLVYGEL